MELKIFIDDNLVKTKKVKYIENDIFETIGKALDNAPIPSKLKAELSNGEYCLLDITKRGKFIKNGVICPSMFVKCDLNTIKAPSRPYKECYLTCINTESNNYKKYHMIPNGDTFNVTYGRIGSERGEMYGTRDILEPYPSYLYFIRYYEKLSKGYIDQSDIYLSEVLVPTEDKKEKEKIEVSEFSQKLFDELMKVSTHFLNHHLKNSNVTVEQFSQSQKLIEILSTKTTVDDFNDCLIKLLVIAPRKTSDITTLLARSVDDFNSILEREEDIVSAMNTIVDYNKGYNSFEEYGINISCATDFEKAIVLSNLKGSGLEENVLQVYVVDNGEQSRKFNSYIREHQISDIRSLWHGSANSNWASIVINSLKIPHRNSSDISVAHGSAFGVGLYFADKALKSFGYTSGRNSYWEHGSSNVCYLGLFDVAYGKPYITNSYCHSLSEATMIAKGTNCTHAYPNGTSLMNPEIITYNESSANLRYLVQLSA